MPARAPSQPHDTHAAPCRRLDGVVARSAGPWRREDAAATAREGAAAP